jgi:hypothetical protein
MGTDASSAGPARVDLGPVVQAIAHELSGAVEPERIEALLRDLLEQEFSDARVTTFLPIFLHRVARDSLKRDLAEAHRRPW